MQRFILTLSFLILSICTQAQTYGNEWIQSDQVYYTFSLNKSGIYRLTYADLKNAGVPVDLIQPRNFQLFTKGEQVRIWVNGEADNKFEAGDYIEFYGTYNDGTTDSALYRKSSEQPHTYASLYQDSLPYYLTWSLTKPGLRYTLHSDLNFSGLTADSSFRHTEFLRFSNQHFDGSPYANLGFYSEYTEGEGYMSQDIRGNNHIAFNISTPGAIAAGPKPRLTVLAFGKSDPSNATDFDPDGNNHEFELSIGVVGSHKILFAKRHRGYSRLFFDTIVEYSDIAASTRINCRSSFGAKARQAVSFIKLEYSRKFDFLNTSNLLFESGTNSYIKFVNYSASRQNPVILDLKNGYRYNFDLQSGTLQFKTKGAGLIACTDSVDIQVITQIKKIDFGILPLPSQNFDYLIISHSSLKTSAQEYKTYRESAAGGSHRVALLYADELYHLFYYGIHHPLALRNAYKYYQESSSQIRHILLLGKGQIYNRVTFSPVNRNQLDLVPTAGIPASDFLVFADYDMLKRGDTVAIGRVPATSNEQVLAYLQKVKTFESDYNFQTKKKIVQVSGGLDITESQSFVSYLDEFYEIFRTSKVGGDRDLFSKETSTSTDESLADLINSSINEGCVMIDYFGHAAKDLLEVSFGNPSDIESSSGFPIFAFNGCVVGSSYEEKSLVENFILEPNNGAITWIGQTSYGFTSELSRFSKVLRNSFYNELYGNSNGNVFINSLYDYNRVSTNYSNSVFHQTSFHGDPAIVQFIKNKPDFLHSGNLPRLIEPGGLTSEYAVQGEFLNEGQITSDSIVLRFEVFNADNQLISSKDTTLEGNNYRNSYQFTTGLKVNQAGTFNFRLSIDPMNIISEFGTNGELNNILNYPVILYSNLPEILYPQRDQIVEGTNVRLLFHNKSFGNPRNFIIQSDTSPDFNSNLFQEIMVNSQEELVSANISLAPLDSTDYYVRLRADGTDDWKTIPFAFVYRSRTGWSHGNAHKFDDYTFDNLTMQSDGSMEFSRIATSNYAVDVRGKLAAGRSNILYGGLVTVALNFGQLGIRIMCVNPENNKRYTISNSRQIISTGNYLVWGIPANFSELEYYLAGAPSGNYNFNTTLAAERDSFIDFLNKVPDGYYLFMISGVQTGIADWEDDVFEALAKFGSDKIKLINDEFPFGLIGQKGSEPGTAIEALPSFENQVLTPPEQALIAQTPLFPKSVIGNLQSLPIGPAKSWGDIYLHLKEIESNDTFYTEIFGIDTLGDETRLFADTGKVYYDLSAISAEEFPKIYFSIHYTDKVNRTAPQLERAIVHYVKAGDGIVLQSLSQIVQEKDTVYQGDSLSVRVAFYNYTSDTLAEIASDCYVFNQNIASQQDTFPAVPLYPGDTIYLNKIIKSDKLKKNAEFFAQFNTGQRSEETDYNNNYFKSTFEVREDITEPVIKVLVEGRQLFNQEIISSRPEFTVLFKDDNPNTKLSKDHLKIRLKLPGDTLKALDLQSAEFGEISSSGQQHWLQLPYHPELSKNGIYTFEASVEDPYNHKVSSQELQFKIETAKKISEIYPYPNPTTGKTQFVFTLTGDVPPEDVLVRIYTISGKLIRELKLNSMGDLKIGNNISSVIWDGKDEFGDPVGNGVYLYNTKILDHESYEKIVNEGDDKFFEQNLGKIYLMR